jgi:GNAT superfamily N-acetyltransferase
VIRPARIDDADALAELNARAWWAAYGEFVDHAKIAATVPRLPEGWRRGLAGLQQAERETWVLDREGQLAGWVTVGRSRDEDARAGDGELWALYVAPERIGTGDGRALLAHGEARLVARGHSGATLWVFEANERARRFYERNGWALDERSGTDPWVDWGHCVRYRRGIEAGGPASGDQWSAS